MADAYAVQPDPPWPRSAAIDEMCTMAPPPPFCITGTTALVSMNGAARLTVRMRLEQFDRGVEEAGRGRDGRVVHQDVDGPVLGHRLVDDALTLAQIAQVGDDDRGLTTFLLDHVQRLFGPVLDHVDEHHLRPLPGEQHRHCLSGTETRSAGPGAGDDGDLAFKPA